MVDRASAASCSGSDDEVEGTDFNALVDAPVTAVGLSSSDAEALEQALGVKTVRDLAVHKYVRRAQAILHLAEAADNGAGWWSEASKLMAFTAFSEVRRVDLAPAIGPDDRPPILGALFRQRVRQPVASWRSPRAPAEAMGWRPPAAPNRRTRA